MKKCDGYGFCLLYNDDENKYYKDPNIECKYDCKIEKCPNYLLCREIMPKYMLLAHDGLCMNCDISFGRWDGGKGILTFKNNIQCPICLETNHAISLPKCNHFICINCFFNCYYYDRIYVKNNPPPQFPYPKEIENEYDKDPDIDKWKNDELIQKWDKKYNEWYDEKDTLSYKGEYISNCPLCSLKNDIYKN